MPDGRPPVYDPNTRRAPLTPITPQAGIYGAPAGAGASGPGFKYDRATLEQLKTDWNDMANEFQVDQARARTIATAQGPGVEYASEGNADHVRRSGEALLDTLIGREKYCRTMAAKFEAALGKYARAEDTHSTEITRTGGSL
ncbi:hypothetical protein DMA12_02225 [Amycolatopsis balhimycina DSM 5908]|uniref:PE domain-containing protein n=1 Tax=Amycolatopsis balhimycina DSM 5908 TaxID=1081091 RepID=A0A428X428_AMYBA|nr:hypothetical protein [Amycolatopsis balhimycina]RSM50095.1 hypothetical protein DMA12_02225 [Amycolatopsis balhimycina DSM 5908]